MEKNGYKYQTLNVTFEMTINSNLLAQFSRQIVVQIIVQIIGIASPKVCGNLAIRPLY
jgi:hypothetical protein